MKELFLVKLKIERLVSESYVKKSSESYLVQAESHSQAEEIVKSEIHPYAIGEFTITGILKENVAEVFPNDAGELWYKSKVVLIVHDEERCVSCRKSVIIYAEASSIEEAVDSLKMNLKDTDSDYEIVSVTATAIVDIFLEKATK